MFDGCKLTRLSIPSDIALTSIPKYAFRNNSLTGKIVLPSQITSFGSFAFGGDDDSKNSLTSVEFQATGLLSVGASAFKNNQIANDPITGKSFSMLGEFAFANNNLSRRISFEGDWSGYPGNGIIAGNEMVEEVVLSPHWLLVPDRMFDGVSHLKSVQFPTGEKKISHIGSQAFRGCTGIEEIDFKDAPLADSELNSIAIGASAFEGCTSLRAVHVGNGVFGSQSRVTLTIGDSAFKGCTALSFIDIPEPTSGVTTFSVNIGNRAFMDTNLGAFPGPDNTALGFLPFDRRRVLSIGASAFENAGLKGVTLPDTLGSVGDRAFAGNHMTNLELPRNKSLDEPGKVGSDILADQTVKTPAVWGDSIKGGPGKADIILEALHGLGVVHGRVDSVSLNVPNTAGGFDHLTPENSETWPEDDRATYDRGLVTTPSATFTYGYQVWREGGERALSHGTVTQGSVKKGIPFEFYYYDNEEFSGTPDTHTQWVGEDFFPVENMHGLGNFGLEKPGYRTFPGAYEPRYNAGWRDGSGPGDTGQPVDPEIIPAVDGQKPKFYNRWIANSYSVSFDDNWEEMVAKSPELGKDDGSGTIVRNDRWVSGSTANMTGLVYGESAPLPENGFKMGPTCSTAGRRPRTSQKAIAWRVRTSSRRAPRSRRRAPRPHTRPPSCSTRSGRPWTTARTIPRCSASSRSRSTSPWSPTEAISTRSRPIPQRMRTTMRSSSPPRRRAPARPGPPVRRTRCRWCGRAPARPCSRSRGTAATPRRSTCSWPTGACTTPAPTASSAPGPCPIRSW